MHKTAFALTFTVLFAMHTAEAQSQAEEYRIKAAFIFHFAQLTDWPDDSGNSKAPFVVCTIGSDPFRGALEDAMNGKTLHDRPVRVDHAKQLSDARSCNIAFIGDAELRKSAAPLDELKLSPVLTIGDAESFVLQQGGIIGFCLEDNKVRFDVNIDAADRARLRISSKLLLLAKIVIGKQARPQ